MPCAGGFLLSPRRRADLFASGTGHAMTCALISSTVRAPLLCPIAWRPAAGPSISPPQSSTVLYRVIGVRADGTRRVLLQGASRQEAETICSALVPSAIFSVIIIEPDQGPAVDESDLPADIPPDTSH